MCTLALQGKITITIVKEEIFYLSNLWKIIEPKSNQEVLLQYISIGDYEKIDLFDRIQLEGILKICQRCKSLSEVGRILFTNSRKQKQKPNDADRLRKYLSRFKIEWTDILKG